MKRINYESDFILQTRLPEEIVGNDFRIELTTNGTNIYVASRINGELSENIAVGVNPNEYSIILRRHGLGCGRLRMKVYAYYKNVNSPDGKIQEVVPLTNLDVELWAKATDDTEIPTIEIKSGGWGVYDDTELRELTLDTRNTAFERIDALNNYADGIKSGLDAVGATVGLLTNQINTKQDKLVSKTNIKTINGQSVLGSGNIQIKEYDDTEIRDSIAQTNADGFQLLQRVLQVENGITTVSNSKQNTLVSGENIKTINKKSLLGKGDIEIKEYDENKVNALINDLLTPIYTALTSAGNLLDEHTAQINLRATEESVVTRVSILTNRINTIGQSLQNKDTELSNEIREVSNGTVVLFENLTTQLDDRPTKNEVNKAIKNAITNTLNTGV